MSKEAMDIARYHEHQALRAFFDQEGITLSDEFIERFEAFRAGVRASEDKWIIDHCTQQFTHKKGTIVIIQLNKVVERMQYNQKEEVYAYKKPWEPKP